MFNTIDTIFEGVFIKDISLDENYQLENAVENTLKKIPGAVAIINASIHYDNLKKGNGKYWGYSVEGTVLIDPQYVALYGDTDYVLAMTEGNDFIVKYVNEAEFLKHIAMN